MTKAKMTKRALLSSALALFLCFAMLLGTTFAWFTDSVTSANNIIMSGNLDIELEYWDGTEWKTVAGASDILTNTLWEPGATEVAYLKVKNAGSLALKYQLGINIVSETAGVNVAGDPFNLSDYIMFGVVESTTFAEYANRDAAVAAVASAKKISEGYTKADSLAANAAPVYLALVVYMPTSVANEANHNGVNVPKIELGINVVATQLTAEFDSFDEYYDAGAPWLGGIDTEWYTGVETEYVIRTAEELAGLAQLVNEGESFAGKTIKLGGNIDLNNLAWTPIGNWDNVFAGTFDGNGKVVSNLYINDAEGEGVGFFGVTEKATLKNVTIENVNIKAYSMVAGIVGAPYPATIENCHITGDVNIVADYAYVAGIAGYCYYGTQVTGCSTIANDTGLIKSETRNAVGGITAWLLEGNHNVTNCTVKNLDLVGWTNVGGVTGFVHYNNTIADCTVENVTLTKTRADGNPGIGLIAGGWSYSANNAITLKNNSISNATITGTHIAYAAYDELYGSEYNGKTTTNFVLENNTANNVTNDLVEVTKVTTAADLETALKAGGTVVLGKNIKVSSDIAISGANFVLDGNGYTISGTSNNAIFDITGGTATIKNVIFDGIKNGAAVRTVNGVEFTADNVTVQNCEHTMPQGLFRLLGKSTITNCTFKNNTCSMAITLNYDGANNDPQLVENCVFENNTCNGTAVLYYVKGAGATISNNSFIGNTVNCNNNGATVYMGFTENNVVTGNLFENNIVTDVTSSTRVSGGIFFGYETVFENNAFINNKVSNANNTALGNNVCVSTYYTSIDLSSNYWGGSAPVEDEDYFVQHKSDERVVIINDYLTTYTK